MELVSTYSEDQIKIRVSRAVENQLQVNLVKVAKISKKLGFDVKLCKVLF